MEGLGNPKSTRETERSAGRPRAWRGLAGRTEIQGPASRKAVLASADLAALPAQAWEWPCLSPAGAGGPCRIWLAVLLPSQGSVLTSPSTLHPESRFPHL